MNRTRIVHHGPAYAALIRSPQVQGDLYRRAIAIARAAGGAEEGFYPQTTTPHTRARAAVVAPGGDSDNKLIHNLDAGR